MLHACCAPCMTHPYQTLFETFDVICYFYNPNIHPRKEYDAREEEIRGLAGRWNAPLIVGSNDLDEWMAAIRGHEDDEEGGERCAICYRFRLQKTAEMAKQEGCGFFTTTLSISPHKKADVINAIGREIAEAEGLTFYEADFKKKNGFRISSEISREEGLYRQNYCGCVFSQRPGK